MSTRTNVYIEFGKTRLFIYRHCDGYPAGAGADLAEKLAAAVFNADKVAGRGVAGRFVQQLLAARYDDGAAVYEVTTALHGDIEWLYAFKFSHRYTYLQKHADDKAAYAGGVRVAIQPRAFGDDATLPTAAEYGSPAKLVMLVNQEKRETLSRINVRQLDAATAEAWRADCAPIANPWE